MAFGTLAIDINYYAGKASLNKKGNFKSRREQNYFKIKKYF